MEREPPDIRWHDFTAKLSDQEHRQLVLALGAGLREARKAAQTPEENGLVRDAIASLDLAIDWLTQARHTLEND